MERSTEFVIKDTEANDPTAFLAFKEDPNLEKLPALIPRPEFNIEKHTKLCTAVKGSLPESGYQELLALPQVLKNYPPCEEFTVLLERIRHRVIAPESKAAPISADPNNEQLDAFKKSGVIEKVWIKPQFLLSPFGDRSKTSSAVPLQRVAEKRKLHEKSTVAPASTADPVAKEKMDQPKTALKVDHKRSKKTAESPANDAPITSKAKVGRPRKILIPK
uniref:Uncharacterized protein n=1 Tax=Panagrolaimus superbus TaxID=310955 RepID=A0A914YD38_9BILA